MPSQAHHLKQALAHTLSHPMPSILHHQGKPLCFFLLTGAWNPDYPKLLKIWHDEIYMQHHDLYKFLWYHVSLIYRNLTINVQRFWHNSYHNVTSVTLSVQFRPVHLPTLQLFSTTTAVLLEVSL